MMRIWSLALAVLIVFGPVRVAAQDQQTLADIRQELTVLYVEVQRLKRELSTTGTPSVNLSGTSVLERVNAIEAELQRLTSQSEKLENRVDRVVQDGTNRIGDLEFRLVELEGGDVSQLGETTTLGGDAPTQTQVVTPVESENSELAVGEEADFKAAMSALESGDNAAAADLFASFNQNYPGSPLAAKVDLNRGKSLEGLGNTREAARAFLASFTADPEGPDASQALFELGAALGRLGQTSQACVTLAEVAVRFPMANEVAAARQEMATLGCS